MPSPTALIAERYVAWLDKTIAHIGCHYGKKFKIVAESLGRVAFPRKDRCPGPMGCQRHAVRLARTAHRLSDDGYEPAGRVAEKAECWDRLFERFIQTYGVPRESLADAVSSGQVSIEQAIEELCRE